MILSDVRGTEEGKFGIITTRTRLLEEYDFVGGKGDWGQEVEQVFKGYEIDQRIERFSSEDTELELKVDFLKRTNHTRSSLILLPQIKSSDGDYIIDWPIRLNLYSYLGSDSLNHYVADFSISMSYSKSEAINCELYGKLVAKAMEMCSPHLEYRITDFIDLLRDCEFENIRKFADDWDEWSAEIKRNVDGNVIEK
ncbi:MAG: hypothetical protein FWC91_09520 [Defluviitaleaceae bacterium]|nr:hypothetical protein [Defluviitaleaceae bacterium]